MHRLILLRHAETEQHSAGGDFDRALTPRGQEDAALAGQTLASRGFKPDLALVSTARRAVQTWEALRTAFPDARAELEPELYNASAEALFAVAQAAEASTVVVVAHNPGLQMLALDLVVRAGAGRDAGLGPHHSPPGAAAVFRFEGGAPVFEAMIAP